MCHETVLVDALKQRVGDLFEPVPVGAGARSEAAPDVPELVQRDRHRVLSGDGPELIHRVDQHALASVDGTQMHRGPLSGNDVHDDVGRRWHQRQRAESAGRELPLVLERRGHPRDVGIARRHEARVEARAHTRESRDRVDRLDTCREALRVEALERDREFRREVALPALARARDVVPAVTRRDEGRRVRPLDDPVQVGLRGERLRRTVPEAARVDLDRERAGVERLRLDLKGAVRRHHHGDRRRRRARRCAQVPGGVRKPLGADRCARREQQRECGDEPRQSHWSSRL